MEEQLSRKYIEELGYKLKSGSITEKEHADFNNWYQLQVDKESVVLSETYAANADVLKTRMYAHISRRIALTPRTKGRPHLLWKKVAIAASFLIVMGTAVYFMLQQQQQSNNITYNYKTDFAPGGNKAVLTLSGGKKIVLNKAKNGQLMTTSGIRIVKNKDGQVTFVSVAGTGNDFRQHAINTLSTPMGGQYELILPDGSRVWLNAASSIKFPSSFSGSQNRKVTLAGEAYFQIAKDKKHPFIVETGHQQVEVLGTQFNVNSYVEKEIKTTLLEGAVLVSSIMHHKILKSRVLAPGQQSVTLPDVIRVKSVDVDEAIGWTKGTFVFTDRPLKEIMESLARWYNVEIVYQDDEISKETFGINISRTDKASKILHMLELTGNVHFKIEGRRITVMK